MAGSNSYSSKIADKTNYELIQILENQEKFKDEILLLTIIEMENRGLKHSSLSDVKDKIIKKQSNRIFSRANLKINSNNTSAATADSPRLYSNLAIYLHSVIFGIHFGGILFIMNLYAAKAKGVWATIGFVVLYLTFVGSILATSGQNLSLLFLLNAIGGVLLNTLFKRQFLSDVTAYKKRNSFIPLAIGMIITFAIYYFVGSLLIA